MPGRDFYYEIKRGDVEAQVVDAYVHPVKSLYGITVPALQVTENGAVGLLDEEITVPDRAYTLAGTAPDNEGRVSRFTLRECPRLARVTVAVRAGWLVLTAPNNGRELTLPLWPDDTVDPDALVTVRSFGGNTRGTPIDVDGEANDWLRAAAKRDDVQMLAVPDHPRRPIDKADQYPDAAGYAGRATDGSSLHIASLSTLRRVNTWRQSLDQAELDPRSMRANLWIDGPTLPGFIEETFAVMRFSGDGDETVLTATGECVRCTTIAVVPGTGEQLDGVLKSLSAQRRIACEDRRPIFGIYAAQHRHDAESEATQQGIIRVGMAMRATRR